MYNSEGYKWANGGLEYVNDTAAHAVEFVGIHVVAAAVISAISGSNVTGNTIAAASQTLPAGMFLPIAGTSITLSSGKVLLVKKVS